MARYGSAIFVLMIYCSVQCVNAQSKPSEDQATNPLHADSGLTMTIIGNGKLRSGHVMAFRIYKAPDGSEGKVTYATLPTAGDAEQQIAEWSKFVKGITTHEHNIKKGTTLVDDRIVGSRKLIQKDASKTRKTKIYLIIRRDGLNCYFVESLSMSTAIKIEDLIDQS